MPTPSQISDALDGRRLREQDISIGYYIGPIGDRGASLVTLPGSDRPVLVSSALGRMTFAPGEAVLLASVSAGGSGGPFTIVAPPPPGAGGQSGSAPRKQPAPPAPPPDGVLWALYTGTAGLLRAWRYGEDGRFAAEVRTLSIDPATVVLPSCIPVDAGAKVGAGSFAFSGATGPVVWDPAGNHLYARTAVGPLWTAPAYLGGRIYWWEQLGVTSGSPAAGPPYLMRARCDFTEIEFASALADGWHTGSVSDVAGEQEWSLGPPVALTDATGYLGALGANAPSPPDNGFVHKWAFYRGLDAASSGAPSGGSLSDPYLDALNFAPPQFGLAALDGTSVLLNNPSGGFAMVNFTDFERDPSTGSDAVPGSFPGFTTLASRAAEADAVFAPLWPSTDAWKLDGWVNASLSRDRTNASIYGMVGPDAVLLVGPSTAPFPTAPSRIVVQKMPALSAAPTFVYLG